jgi:glucan phosphorylase
MDGHVQPKHEVKMDYVWLTGRLKQDLDALKEQHQQEVSELKHRNEELQSVFDRVWGVVSPSGQGREPKEGLELRTSIKELNQDMGL